MRKSLYIRLSLLFCILLSVKGFAQNSNISEGCVPLEVQFTAPVGNGSYFWDFKDGSFSNLQNPVPIFTEPGDYAVTFHEVQGGPVLKTINITVYPKPEIKFDNTSLGCVPYNAEFTNQTDISSSVSINNYVWVFGDGDRLEGQENPSHIYSQTGSYNVSLGIETEYPSCNVTTLFYDIVEVTNSPQASFSTTPSDLFSCTDPINVSFNNASTGTKNLQYSWDLGNGITSSGLNPSNQTYREGQYIINLEVSYPDAPSCKSNFSKSVSIGTPKPVIELSEDSFCMNETIKVKTPTPGRLTWDVDEDHVIFLPPFIPESQKFHQREFELGYVKRGERTISLNVVSPDGRCTGDTSVNVLIKGFDIEVVSSPDYVCDLPQTFTYDVVSSVELDKYEWTFSGLSDTTMLTDSIRNPVRTLDSTDSEPYYHKGHWINNIYAKVTGTSEALQCSFSASFSNVINLPVAYFKPLTPTKGCAPLNVSFEAQNYYLEKEIVKFYWNYGDGTVDETTFTEVNSTSHTYSEPGDYEAFLVIETESGCIDTSFTILVEVGTDLSSEIDFVSDKSEVCPGEPLTFSVSKSSPLIDGFHFSTENKRSFHCSDETSLTWAYKHESGPQDVELLVDYNGCISGINKADFVNVKGAVAKIEYSAPCSDPDTYTFISKSQNATSLTWDFSDGSTGDQETEVHTFSNNWNYAVTLTAQNEDGCAATTDEVEVMVRDVKAVIQMDTLLCRNVDYMCDASKSKDVYGNCYTGYTWQFPTLSEKRPFTTDNSISKFTFDTTGWHTARLIVKDINGCRDTTEKQFKVYDMVVAAKASDNLICIPDTVFFTDLTQADTTIKSWSWNFENEIDTRQNPEHAYLDYPVPGANYFPTLLSVTDVLGCTERISFPVYWYKPISQITASKNGNLCFGDSVSLTASDYTSQGSSLRYEWDFGNGTFSTERSNKLIYDSLKSYTVKLIYAEIATGCIDSTDFIIEHQAYPVAGFETDKDSLDTFCADLDLSFKDTSWFYQDTPHGPNYWSFGNGQSTVNRPEYALTYGKGTYEVTLIASTSFQCKDTVSRVFDVFRPEGDFVVNENAICKGDSILFSLKDTSDVYSYTWAFGDGDTLRNVDSVWHKYDFHPPNGTTVGKLVLYDKKGCEDPNTKSIRIHQVIADFDRDSLICYNDGPSIFVNKSKNDENRTWYFGDGDSSTSYSPVHQYDTAGYYDVTLAISDSQLGCVDTITKLATIFANPVLTAIGDTGCLGTVLNPYIVNPVATNTYTWTPEIGLDDPSSPTPIADLQFSQIYSVLERDTNNCTDRKNVRAIVIRPIELSDWDTTIIVGDIATIPVKRPEFYIFDWSPATGLSCLDCDYPTAQPLEDITYTLTVSDSLGCFVDPFYQTINVRPETFVKLPTTFTPNGDGANDVIFVKGWGIKELIDFRIFNRWGQEIYSSTDLDQGWDGTFNGVVQTSDMYVYKVKVLTWRDEELYKEGYINLMH